MKEYGQSLPQILCICAVCLLSSKLQAEEMKLTWDFRYRHERLDEDGGVNNRNRQRIRARFTAKKRVNEHLEGIFRLATGGSDPVSTNQSLDDGFSSKGINLDLAYLNYTPNENLEVYAGKMNNPLIRVGKSQLIWDGDLSPEGLALSYKLKDLKFNLASFWLEERSSAKDSYAKVGQIHYKIQFSNSSLKIGGGFLDFSETVGNETFYDSTDAFGNSATASGSNKLYSYNYELYQGFAEFDIRIGKLPLKFFYDFVINKVLENDNKGYLAGLIIGKGKEPGTFKFSYNYRKVEKDSVLGVFTDSDFKGGGTDGKGHKLGLNYVVTRPVSLGVTHFINKNSITNGKDFQRTQVDLKMKF